MTGTLDASFLITNGQVLVKLRNVQPLPDGNVDADLWVPAQSVERADSLESAEPEE